MRHRKIIHMDTSRMGRLHCDNPLCGYDLQSDIAFGAHLIGFPCPHCGMSMLTLADYKLSMKLIRYVKVINFLFGWLFGTYEPPAKGEGVEAKVRMHNDVAIVKIRKHD